MKTVEVPIGRGVALVDEDDLPLIRGFRWHANKSQCGKVYARARVFGPRGPWMSMHRLLMMPPEGMLVDHADGNGLNNSRSNIRICTRAQNMWNAKRRRNVMKYRGVDSFGDGRFFARIMVNGVRHSSGAFASQEEAAVAYNEMALKYHGEFATINQCEQLAAFAQQFPQIVAQLGLIAPARSRSR